MGACAGASTANMTDEIKEIKNPSCPIPKSSSKKPILSQSRYLYDIPHWFEKEKAHKDILKILKIHDRIGHGESGDVFNCTYKHKHYAVKRTSKCDEFGSMTFTTEARSLSKLKHPSIIRYIDALMDEKYYYLVMEKAHYDLYYLMKRNGIMSEQDTKHIIYHILRGIAYMHKKKFVHRDIKPENIVFVTLPEENHVLQPLLIDFGDVAIVKEDKIYKEFVGTVPYMSPGRIGEHNAEQLMKSDVWAIACLAFEMVTGQRCFDGDTEQIIFGKILCGDWSWPNDQEKPSECMQSFVSQCLEMDVAQRLSAKDALQHEWFDDIRVQMDDERIEKVDVVTKSLLTPGTVCNDDEQTDTDHIKGRTAESIELVEIESVSTKSDE